MELGGNAPFIVFDDADIPAAVEGALIAKMRNGGEACTAANRFYVHDAVADEFIAAFSARLAALVVGPGLDETTELGPLVNEDDQVQGGRAWWTARRATARRWSPAAGRRSGAATSTSRPCSTAVPADAAILCTEIFGPVAPVVRFTDEADAIRWANASEFGLVSYVYTRTCAAGCACRRRSRRA